MVFDREDISHIDIPESVFYRKWEPGEPEAVACDYADVIADGPFLLRANDEAAWISHGKGDWIKVALNTRYDGPDQRRWSALATLYAASEGLSLRNLTYRILGIKRRLYGHVGVWVPWDDVYRWDDGSELVWSGLMYHEWLGTRVGTKGSEVCLKRDSSSSRS